MNDYIFDWVENSEKILNGEGYTTNIHQFIEQKALFRYLMDQKYTKDEIYDLWLTTRPNVVQKVDDNNDDLNFYFGKIWTQASRWKINKYSDIKIYQSEIDFINSMEVLMWVKQYILALLCIYKYYDLTWCSYTQKFKAFCFSVTSHRRERDEHKAKISECLNTYHPYELNLFNEQLSFKMNFVKHSGKVVAKIANPRHVEELFGLLKCEKVCEHCGKVFTYTSQSINNTLCPECHKRERYRKQYECHKKQQAIAKID